VVLGLKALEFRQISERSSNDNELTLKTPNRI
jgi:hypothetical protein